MHDVLHTGVGEPLDQLPVIPIAQYESHTLVSSRVRDLTMSAFGTFDASKVKLVG